LLFFIFMPLGQCKSAPGIQYNAASPDKEIFHGNMRFLTVFGMEHPSVINGTVYNASYHGTRECGIKIKNSKSLYQKDSHQKIDNVFILSKIIVAVLVAFFWNYHLQRFFVYRNHNIKGFLKHYLENKKDEYEL
jgi:hypothetical protein